MKKIKDAIKAIIASYRKRRDDRFRERIDRVYFRHDGDGLRYIAGHLVLVKDDKTGRDGNLVVGAYLTYSDALATKDCIGPRTGDERKYPSLPKHQ